MDNEPVQNANEPLSLTSEQRVKLNQRIIRCEDVVHALHILARRSYFSTEQAALIHGEANELVENDIKPIRAALRDGTISANLLATIGEFDGLNSCDAGKGILRTLNSAPSPDDAQASRNASDTV